MKGKNEFRRSIVLSKPLNAGTILTAGDIAYKRPGSGMKPEMTNYVLEKD